MTTASSQSEPSSRKPDDGTPDNLFTPNGTRIGDAIKQFDWIDQAQDVVPLEEIKKLQDEDPWCQGLLQTSRSTDKAAKKDPRRRANRDRFEKVDDVLYRLNAEGQRRIVIPEKLRDRLIDQAHSHPLRGHRGRDATAAHLADRFWWPLLVESVGDWIKGNCLPCFLKESSKPLRQGLLNPVLYSGDGTTLAMDLVGPLPESEGHRYILTMVDVFSHFLRLEVVDTKQDTAILDAFIKGIMLRGHLPSELIISDNGGEFSSNLFKRFLAQFTLRFSAKAGADDKEQPLRHRFTIPYHPQSNGAVERVNRFIKEVLLTLINTKGRTAQDWPALVPYAEFSYNCLSIPGTKITPFMLRLGRQPHVPDDYHLLATDVTVLPRDRASFLKERADRLRIMLTEVKRAHEAAKEKQKLNYDIHQIDLEFEVGDRVLEYRQVVPNKFVFRWTGPFVVRKKLNRATYYISTPTDPDNIRLTSVQFLRAIQDSLFDASVDLADPRQYHVSSEFAQNFVQGRFVLFRMPRSGHAWKKEFHVGETFEPFDHANGVGCLHFYVDLGKDDLVKNFDPTKPLKDRVLLPEWKDKDGNSFTNPRRRTQASTPALHEFNADEIDIIVAPFDLHNKKIPKDVILKAQKVLQAGRRTS